MRKFMFVASLYIILAANSAAQRANNKDVNADTLKVKTLETVTIRGQKPFIEQRADGIPKK